MIFIFKILVCYVTYWLTYRLNHQYQLGAVKASAYLALIIGSIYQLLIALNFEIEKFRDYFLIMMGATFMGMIANVHRHQSIDFIISSIIFCTLYHNSSIYFNGLGGLLGTIACISILCVFGIERIIKLIK